MIFICYSEPSKAHRLVDRKSKKIIVIIDVQLRQNTETQVDDSRVKSDKGTTSDDSGDEVCINMIFQLKR